MKIGLKLVACSFLGLLLFAYFVDAQQVKSKSVRAEQPQVEAPGFRSVEPLPTAAGVARQAGVSGAEGICRVTFCTTDLSKVLVHDAKGQLVATARSIDIKMDRIGDPPRVMCKLYDGLFEPTGTSHKTWLLAEIRFVDDLEFQKLVDQAAKQATDVPVSSSPPNMPSGVDLNNVTPLIPKAQP